MPKNLRRRGKTWWYRIRHEGKDFEGSLETSDLGQAKVRLDRIREELNATAWGEKPRHTFNDAATRVRRAFFHTTTMNVAMARQTQNTLVPGHRAIIIRRQRV